MLSHSQHKPTLPPNQVCWEQLGLEAQQTPPSSPYSFTTLHNSWDSRRKADILTVLYFESCWERSGWEPCMLHRNSSLNVISCIETEWETLRLKQQQALTEFWYCSLKYFFYEEIIKKNTQQAAITLPSAQCGNRCSCLLHSWSFSLSHHWLEQKGRRWSKDK